MKINRVVSVPIGFVQPLPAHNITLDKLNMTICGITLSHFLLVAN